MEKNESTKPKIKVLKMWFLSHDKSGAHTNRAKFDRDIFL